LIRGYGKPVVVALNKIDELSEELLFELKETKKFQNSALNDLIIVNISALQKRGFKKLFNTLAKVNKVAKTKFTTGRLNKLLTKFTNSTNTPNVSGRQIKMRYIHFGGIHPTKFIIHSNISSKIPSNYKRYLINSFREELNLKSVELNIIFKKGDNPFEGKVNKLSPRQIKKKQRLVKYTKKNK
jgi:GTP-binding protein